MNESLKYISKVGINIGLILLIITLEWSTEKMYLRFEVIHAFRSHWFFYFILSSILTWLFWKFELKNIKSNILKIITTIAMFGLTFYLSNRIELMINSQFKIGYEHQYYQVRLKGIAWGKIGIKDLKTGIAEEIKVSNKEINKITDKDTVKLEFKKGVFGFKYDPIIQKE